MNAKSLFLRTIGRIIPSDYFAKRYPVSVKGICLMDGQVILLRNERGEWDFPGGKLQGKESLQCCLEREIKEELSISVEVGPLLYATTLRILRQINVVVLLYRCFTTASPSSLRISSENFDLSLFSIDEALKLELPKAYQKALRSLTENQ